MKMRILCVTVSIVNASGFLEILSSSRDIFLITKDLPWNFRSYSFQQKIHHKLVEYLSKFSLDQKCY